MYFDVWEGIRGVKLPATAWRVAVAGGCFGRIHGLCSADGCRITTKQIILQKRACPPLREKTWQFELTVASFISNVAP
jgi:hypothetical protein